MPLVRIDLFEGRPEEMKENLMRRVSETVAEVLQVPLDHVQCVLNDVPGRACLMQSGGGAAASPRR